MPSGSLAEEPEDAEVVGAAALLVVVGVAALVVVGCCCCVGSVNVMSLDGWVRAGTTRGTDGRGRLSLVACV